MVISRKQLVHGVAFGFILSINLTALLLNAVKTRIYCKYGGSECVTVLSLFFHSCRDEKACARISNAHCTPMAYHGDHDSPFCFYV